jgi:molecular chaperone GrpE
MNKTEVKKINIKEFREMGYLQELNRRFLHPLGLAMEISINENGDEELSGVWDYRDDSEGIYYDINNSDDVRKDKFKKNKEFIDNEIINRYKSRKDQIGFDIELIPNSPEKYDEKFLNLAADFENFKKRTLKEKEEIANNTKIKMLTSILDMDNDIAIALKNIDDDGVRLIANKISAFLKSQNIEEIKTDEYDEELHEVISVMETGSSKIIDVVSKGYTLNGKPFRFPKVILGK